MGKNNFYTREKEFDGIKYIAQFNGISAYYKMIDSCKDNNGNLNMSELSEYIFDNVIVEPKMTVDDFDDTDTCGRVVKWALNVAQGRLRDKNKSPAEKAGK